MQRWCAAIAVALAVAGSPFAALADETKLIFTTISLPTSEIGIETYHTWVDRINAQGKGVLNIDLRDGTALVQSPNFYDRLRDDVVQISFGSLNYLAGKFQLSVFTTLPFLMNSAEEESVVFWRLYKSGALDSEFDDLMPLFTQAFPQNALHFVKPRPEALEGLTGLKIIASGKTPTQVISHLGGTPLSIPLTESYTALQRGTADGMYFPWAAIPDFHLDEVTKYHIDASLGGGPGGVWMMKKKYQSLPQDVRKLLDDNSGEAQSRVAGQILDQLQAKVRSNLSKAPDQKVASLSPDQSAKWKAMAEPVLDEWAAISPDNAKVLTLVKQEVAKYRAEQH
jgi:TRAP-type C4-dicarboxylate transport system substrate-binding protein